MPKRNYNGSKNYSKNNTALTTSLAPPSPGASHNAIIAEYNSRHGLSFNQTVMTTGMISIQKKILQIAQDNGQLSQDADIDQYAVSQVNEMIADGFFTSAGVLKSKNEINQIGLSVITNTQAKAAIKSIVDYSGTKANFISTVDATLSGLSNLSEADQQLVDGYKRVLVSSFNFWNENYEILTSPIAVAKVDVNGYVKGFKTAYDLGYWWLAGFYAEYYAAKCSIAAL